jgi:hypothetical protein
MLTLNIKLMTSVTTSLDLVSLKMLFLLIHFESTLVFHFFHAEGQLYDFFGIGINLVKFCYRHI